MNDSTRYGRRWRLAPSAAIPCLAAGIALALALGTALPATAQTSASQLQGTVRDADGGALPGAVVTASNPATGFSRSAVAGPNGSYLFQALPIGTYEVSAELDGFSSYVRQGVELRVAQTRRIDITLEVAAVQETITVVDDAPLTRTSPSIGTIVSTDELENLPLNGRQFATLGSLAPGTSLGINPDPTKVGKLVIGLNGGSGRNVNFLIDGGDNTDDTIGGQLQNFSIESVAEFNIQTQQYKAEYGRTTGGVLTVVTKSGTNDFDGSVFGFFRDDSLNAKSETAKRAGIDKPPFERQQYGASLGGPIVRDKTHFFATAEQLDQEVSYTVATRGVFPQLDGRSFPLVTEDTLVTAKVTHQASPTQYLQVRYGYQETQDDYGATPRVTPDALGALKNDFQSILFGHNWVIGTSALNEVVAQYSEFENLILAVSDNPTIYFPGGVQTGQNVNSPQSTKQEKVQLKDDFSFSRTIGGDRHDFKIGAEYIDEGTLGGFFAPGKNGQFSRSADNPNAPITQIIIFGGDFAFSTPNTQYRIYAQDDWQITDRLMVNLGLRYEYTDILELDQRSNPIWQALSTQTRFNESYLRDFQGGRGGVVDADDDDFAPRLGLTWDVTGRGDHLLRGGWGRYYDFPYSNATVLFPTAAVISDFGLAFVHTNPNGIRNPNGTFFQPGDPLPPNQLPGSSVFPPNEVASPTLSTPYAEQASIGWSWQATPWLGFNVEAVSVKYEDLPFRFRANPFVDSNGNGRVDAGETRRFPQFGNFRLWYGKGEAEYEGVNLGVRGRLAQRFEFQGFYTYSEATGNVLAGADEFRLTATEHQPDLGVGRDVTVDPLNPLCGRCIGPLNTDAKNRLTFSGIYRAPLGIVVAGLYRYRSAPPYTVHAGRDLNGDGFVVDLPPGVPHINSRRGASFSQFDLRVSKEFSFATDLSLEVIAEVFNLFDDDNPSGFVGNLNSPAFGRPTSFSGDPRRGEQRLGQLGLRLRF